MVFENKIISTLKVRNWSEEKKKKKRSEDFAPDTMNRIFSLQGECSKVSASPANLSQMSVCLDAEDSAGEDGMEGAKSSATVSNHKDGDGSSDGREDYSLRSSNYSPDRKNISETLDLDHSSAVCVSSPSSVDIRSWNQVSGKKKRNRKTDLFGTSEDFSLDISNRFHPLQECSSATIEANKEDQEQSNLHDWFRDYFDRMAANFEQILLGKPP